MRFAALGDSITLGMGDPLPQGGWRGWAALLADATGEVEFRNFATSGALSLDVMTEQLPQALNWRPHVATVLVGVNDSLRGSFDVKAVGQRMNRVFGELRDAGTAIVTACLPEPGRMLRLPESLGKPLNRRIRAVNEIVHALSDQYRTIHAHVAEHPLVFDRRMWSIDRLHPSERGHRLLAYLCCEALARAGWAVGHYPSLEPGNPPPTRTAQAWWMATKGTRWILKRSTDLLPQLTRLAVAEWRHDRLGRSAQLDQAMALDVQTALEELLAGTAAYRFR